MHTHTRTQMHTHIFPLTPAHITCTHIHTYTHTNAYTYFSPDTCTHNMHTHAHIHTHKCIHIFFPLTPAHITHTQTVMLSVVDKLIRHVESSQLTSDLGGFLPYNHEEWIELRLVSHATSLHEHAIVLQGLFGILQ